MSYSIFLAQAQFNNDGGDAALLRTMSRHLNRSFEFQNRYQHPLERINNMNHPEKCNAVYWLVACFFVFFLLCPRSQKERVILK